MNLPELQTAVWAHPDETGNLFVDASERSIQMHNSDGTGEPLVLLDKFGADIIRFEAGKGVMNHIHPGAHILFVLKGTGIVEYEGVEHALFPGLCYLIPGNTRHAIRAKDDLVLIAVGNNHQPLSSTDRMTPAN